MAHLLHIVVLGSHPEEGSRPHLFRQAQSGVGLVEGQGRPPQKPRLLARDHRPLPQALEGRQDLPWSLKTLQVSCKRRGELGMAFPAQALFEDLFPLG